MRGASLITLAAASTLVSTASAFALEESDATLFQLDIQRKDIADPVSRDKIRRNQRELRKRGTATVSETLDNEQTLYFANVTIGTPAQSLRMHIDTGSSDLWVNTDSSSLCSNSKTAAECTAYGGTYSANDSSTYEYVNSLFNISYADGSGASGDYVSDEFTIGGSTLRLEFGIGYTSTSAEGVLGIGYPTNEAIVAYQGVTPYENLPEAMVSAGLIKASAYSLWLNDLESSTGSILFGGVNAGKYHGTLVSVPIEQEGNEYVEFVISMDQIGYVASDGSSTNWTTDSGTTALLDSGTSLIYLPDSITEDIYSAVGATYYDQYQLAYAPCATSGQGGSLNFTFGSAVIAVGMNELFLNSTTSDGSEATFQDGTAACIFGVLPASDSTPVLGDTFLRSAYVVYDMSNNEIGLANTNFNSDEDKIYEITNGTSGIPNTTGVANPETSSSSSSSTKDSAGAVSAEVSRFVGTAAMLISVFGAASYLF